MKALISTMLICLGFIGNIQCKPTYNWSIPKGRITHVFVNTRNTKEVELLRLYNSGCYENLLYVDQPKNSELVKRNLGTYTLKGSKLIIDKPTFSEFSGVSKIGDLFVNTDVYQHRLSCILKRKNFILKKQTNRKYFKPFYIGINSDEIVSNEVVDQAFNLNDLVSYTIKDIKNEREKVLAISSFICRSIEYDYEAYYHHNYSHNQSDVLGILAGKKRLAVCAGYANVFDSLAKKASINSRVVSGYTKQSFDDIQKLSGAHAWNIVEIEGKEFYIDVTWSDHQKDLQMKWMFVDPELLLLSHYPSNKKDNLFSDNFSENHFKDREVVLPLKANSKIKHFPIHGNTRINKDNLILKFKEEVNVEAYWLDPSMNNMVYT